MSIELQCMIVGMVARRWRCRASIPTIMLRYSNKLIFDERN